MLKNQHQLFFEMIEKEQQDAQLLVIVSDDVIFGQNVFGLG